MTVLRRLLVLAFLVLLAPVSAKAEVRFLCEVSYQTQRGWSEGAIVEVTFMSGRELNAAVPDRGFSSYKNYALLWFGPGQVAVLEHQGYVVTGSEFDLADFKRMFLITDPQDFQQVNIEGLRRWRIKAKESYRFLDPRVKR